MSRKAAIIILCLGALVFLKGITAGILHPPAAPNLYALQADAFLHGRWDIGHEAHDAALYQGNYYVAFPPFPAALLTPIVWAFGVEHTNLVLISLLLSVLNAWLLFRIFKGQGVDTDTAAWMVAAFLMGTAYWMSVKGSYGVWFFAHIVAATGMLLAIHEALGRGRGWLAGLFFGGAVLSRHLSIYALPFMLCALWAKDDKKRSLPSFFGVLTVLMALFFYANWERFGNPLDMGYNYILQIGFLKSRLDTHGLFHIDYFPFNFIYLFLQGFHVQFEGDTLLQVHCLDPFGTSLTFASPFLFTCFWAQWKKGLLFSAWISILLMVVHMLFYYANGYYQINAQRFTLDFMPLLIILAALGAQRCNPLVWKGLILYATLLNIIASAICAFSP